MIQKIKDFFIANKKYGIIFFVGVLIGGISVFFFKKNNVGIISESKTKIEYKKPFVKPDDNKGLYNCYMSPIDIQGKMKNNELTIVAEDNCKKSTKKFKLGCNEYKNIIILNYGVLFREYNLVQSFQVSYYRMIFGRVGIGGGGILQKEKDVFSYGVQVGLIFRW